MKSERSIKNIIAVAFAFALILSSSAQASNLLGLDLDLAPRTAAEQPIGLFDQVSAWLIGAWTDLTAAFAEETTTPPPTTSGCDAGWGLDPEGCPR
jgi:hypothetical protein